MGLVGVVALLEDLALFVQLRQQAAFRLGDPEVEGDLVFLTVGQNLGAQDVEAGAGVR